MRLLNVSTLEIESGFPDVDLQDAKSQLWNSSSSNATARSKYSILSHRWAEEEVTFCTFNNHREHLQHASGDNPFQCTAELADPDNASSSLLPSICKVAGACNQLRVASGNQAAPVVKYIWIDTVCINKDDGDETRLAINSMFRWYAEADMCYVYLVDVVWDGGSPDSLNQFRNSQWFRRGWTLQELLASRQIQFYDRDWRFVGTKAELAGIISEAAEIAPQYLTGDFRTASLGQKMSWLAKRDTKFIEDRAYCMLGIFNVFLDPRYGQGECEFQRLQVEILKTWDKTKPFDETLFAWTTDKVVSSGLFAPAPVCFADCKDVLYMPEFARGRGIKRNQAYFSMTAHQGISIDDSQQLTVQVPFSHGLPKLAYLVTCGILAWCTMLPAEGYENKRGAREMQLNAWRRTGAGGMQAAKVVMKKFPTGVWQRVECGRLLWSSPLTLWPPPFAASSSAAVIQVPNQVEYRR